MNDQLIMFEPHNIMQCIILSRIPLQFLTLYLNTSLKSLFQNYLSISVSNMTVELSPITDNEIEEVRLILCSVLPVTYPPSFYKSLGTPCN